MLVKNLIKVKCEALCSFIDNIYTNCCRDSLKKFKLYSHSLDIIKGKFKEKILNCSKSIEDLTGEFSVCFYNLEREVLIKSSGLLNLDLDSELKENILNCMVNLWTFQKTDVPSFEESLLLEIFVNQIIKKQITTPSNEIKDVLNSFEIIFRCTTFNPDFLISFYKSYESVIKELISKEDTMILAQFETILTTKFKELIQNIEKDFICLSARISAKNRILNIIFHNVTRSGSKKDLKGSLGFQSEMLIDIQISIYHIK